MSRAEPRWVEFPLRAEGGSLVVIEHPAPAIRQFLRLYPSMGGDGPIASPTEIGPIRDGGSSARRALESIKARVVQLLRQHEFPVDSVEVGRPPGRPGVLGLLTIRGTFRSEPWELNYELINRSGELALGVS